MFDQKCGVGSTRGISEYINALCRTPDSRECFTELPVIQSEKMKLIFHSWGKGWGNIVGEECGGRREDNQFACW